MSWNVDNIMIVQLKSRHQTNIWKMVVLSDPNWKCECTHSYGLIRIGLILHCIMRHVKFQAVTKRYMLDIIFCRPKETVLGFFWVCCLISFAVQHRRRKALIGRCREDVNGSLVVSQCQMSIFWIKGNCYPSGKSTTTTVCFMFAW